MAMKEARCKFCGVPLTVEFDEAALGLIRDEAWWLSLGACNTCADHRERVMRYAYMAERFAAQYVVLWNSGVRGGPELERARARLEDLSKRFVGCVAARYRQPNVWDAAWVDELTRQADMARKAFMAHEASARRRWQADKQNRAGSMATGGDR